MVEKVLVCLLAGLGAGLGTGFAGMSAAAVISPMLITFLGMEPYEAVGIALASDVLASAASAWTYGKNKNLDIKNGLIMMVSVLAFTDGKTVKPMVSSMDHKRALDHDEGLNTGGMGNFSPSPFYTKEVDAFCKKYIYQATVDAMSAEGRTFQGVIFFGLMLTPDGPKVLEYNVRFGDPEAQVVLPRMKNDILDVCEACIDGTLDQLKLEFEDNATVCVVLASDGYPLKYDKGLPISGLEAFDGKDDVFCFHAGTRFAEDGKTILTNGGRVLGITAKAPTLKEARAKAYAATEWVNFANKYMRHDIGKAIDEA